MNIQYESVGVCGLGCRLCPNYHRDTTSRCEGCKSKARMALGCPFITCTVKKKEIEFCWQCDENKTCERWRNQRACGMVKDSFKCYQTLERDIAFIEQYGVEAFDQAQKERECILREMLTEFNEGRSKSCFCIAATVLTVDELKHVIVRARQASDGLDITRRSATIHALLSEVALRKGYLLKLRKKK